jgi:hypothetical protein
MPTFSSHHPHFSPAINNLHPLLVVVPEGFYGEQAGIGTNRKFKTTDKKENHLQYHHKYCTAGQLQVMSRTFFVIALQYGSTAN